MTTPRQVLVAVGRADDDLDRVHPGGPQRDLGAVGRAGARGGDLHGQPPRGIPGDGGHGRDEDPERRREDVAARWRTADAARSAGRRLWTTTATSASSGSVPATSRMTTPAWSGCNSSVCEATPAVRAEVSCALTAGPGSAAASSRPAARAQSGRRSRVVPPGRKRLVTGTDGSLGAVSIVFATHARYLDHQTGHGHPERPARLEAVLLGARYGGVDDALVALEPRAGDARGDGAGPPRGLPRRHHPLLRGRGREHRRRHHVLHGVLGGRLPRRGRRAGGGRSPRRRGRAGGVLRRAPARPPRHAARAPWASAS